MRINDAVVTGLCRKFGIRSVGCQTRAIYTKKFEDCFDCYDVYLSWGKSWEQFSKQRMLFVDSVVTVGCIYLDRLLPFCRKHISTNASHERKRGLTVAIFPSDISCNHHYTKGYTRSFLISCTKLAKAFPDYKFIVKTKETEHIKIMMSDKEFFKAYSTVKNNFSFVNNLRYDYTEVLFTSDIIIAIGFTTPGIEGLLLGKRAIYYSELKCGGQAFKHIPFFVANNEGELEELFAKAICDYNNYVEINSCNFDLLDPFRDAQALRRISKIIIEGVK
jgi:polysaccharide biosynthesis PFTS motif protein